MSKPPLTPDAIAMIKKANPAVITTLRPDGQPVSTATWYLWEDDGRVLVNMDEGRKRLEHLRNDPRVTLTVLDEANWYNHISLIGRVAEIRNDSDFAGIDRLSRQYLGTPYAQRDRPRVNAWIQIERWHGWGAYKDSSQAG
ncbi:PPOX class F420-dependent oxidoreductase [Streptomyces sp. NPDC056190]|uniref:PPOX class F420-dependent oxidoreductase n=1 Tax=unclassified Streptomyces TaxID=2593676 RepID=UPI0035D69FA6